MVRLDALNEITSGVGELNQRRQARAVCTVEA